MKLGFIGLGNMASAIIGGILREGIAKPEEIIGSAKTEKTAGEKAAQFGIETCTDNKRIAAQAEVLVMAVKPQFFSEAAAGIRDVLREDTLVISVAAGKKTEAAKILSFPPRRRFTGIRPLCRLPKSARRGSAPTPTAGQNPCWSRF